MLNDGAPFKAHDSIAVFLAIGSDMFEVSQTQRLLGLSTRPLH